MNEIELNGKNLMKPSILHKDYIMFGEPLNKELIQKIIKQYVEQNNIKEINIYIDDLYAGKKKVEVYVK